MAGFEQAGTVLHQAFAAGWDANTIPVEYENSGEFRKPSGRWVRFCLREDGSVQAAMGKPPLTRYTGRVLVQAFTPRSSGTAPLRQMADLVRGIFALKKIGGLVQCRTVQLVVVGQDQGYYQGNITVPFVFHGTD
jgi:hypothetical protein